MQRRPVRVALEWVLTIAVAIVFVLAFEAEVAKPYRIPSASMEPTLRCARPTPGCTAHFSDRVIADRLAYRFRSPRRGEIVVFQAPTKAAALCQTAGVYVKRIVGLPGEAVVERSGRISIDGRPLAEPYVDPADRDRRSGSWDVPAGSYFLLGDNRAASCDSRIWGAVPRRSLIGPVLLRYWPPDRIGFG